MLYYIYYIYYIKNRINNKYGMSVVAPGAVPTLKISTNSDLVSFMTDF